MISYTPNTDRSDALNQLKSAAKQANGRRRTRKLYDGDINDLLDAIDENPSKSRVRSYSRDGFVANSYDYPASIVYCEGNRGENGAWSLYVAEAGAKRSRGEGSLLVIQ